MTIQLLYIIIIVSYYAIIAPDLRILKINYDFLGICLALFEDSKLRGLIY
jgi:hypothetical protein